MEEKNYSRMGSDRAISQTDKKLKRAFVILVEGKERETDRQPDRQTQRERTSDMQTDTDNY